VIETRNPACAIIDKTGPRRIPPIASLHSVHDGHSADLRRLTARDYEDGDRFDRASMRCAPRCR